MANFPFWSNVSPSSYKPTETYTVYSYQNSELIIHRDRLEIVGNIKFAAFALVNELLTDSYYSLYSISSWNNVLRAKHGDGVYTLEYLGEEAPEFFEELKYYYEYFCSMRIFL